MRELPGPAGAPAVVLLHGWNATSDLNFFCCYRALGERYRVLAFDQRGHGHGIRTRRVFRLEDCADDVVALADVLGLERIVPIGYSMGGAVAQLIGRRHPGRVRGLVLCATAGHFNARREERLSFLGVSGLAMLARLTPAQASSWLTTQLYLQRKTEAWEQWAVDELTHHDWRMVLEAGRALGSFRSDGWLASIGVPVSVIVPNDDEVVPVHRQRSMAAALPDAPVFEVDGGHDVAVSQPGRFVPVLLEAVQSVLQRPRQERTAHAAHLGAAYDRRR